MASNTKLRKVRLNGSDGLMVGEAIEQIEELQNELHSINVKASQEMKTIEQKYSKLRQPHFNNRSQHISKIPKFWSQTILNHPELATMFSEDDVEVLTHLEKIEVQEIDHVKCVYTISFTFSENKYFRNKVLEKEYTINRDMKVSTKCDMIDWYPGKSLIKNETGAIKRKASGSIMENSSFFSWFQSSDEILDDDDIEEFIKDDVWNNPLQFYLFNDEDL